MKKIVVAAVILLLQTPTVWSTERGASQLADSVGGVISDRRPETGAQPSDPSKWRASGGAPENGPSTLTPFLTRFLKQKGFQVNESPLEHSSPSSGVQSLEVQSDTAPVDMGGVIVDGLIVRFASAEARARARANEAPPNDLVEQLHKAARVPLGFHRAMSMDAFVFRFTTPLTWEEAEAVIERLRALPGIDFIEADVRMQVNMIPNDPYYYDYQWSLAPPEYYPGGINAEDAWNITTGSSATVVAVIDTGITNPSSFGTGRVLPGYDFISDVFTANDGNGRDPDPSDPGDWRVTGECPGSYMSKPSSWHGTHVAGTIAARGNDASGIAGINWRTRVLPVRVLGKCGGNRSDTVDGMLWAAGLPVAGVPNNPNPARVINMSLGGPSPSGCANSIYQEAINRIKSTNSLIVVAAGNDDTEAARFVPASCEGVMTVGAVDHLGYRASYSNYSFDYRVAISAPGGDQDYYGAGFYGIVSTSNTGKTTLGGVTFEQKSGTSMAAPHVAGVASLAMAVDPEQHAEMIGAIMGLVSRPFPTGSSCDAYYPICGSGILDAHETLLAVEAMKPYRLVWDFYNPDLNHYFRTGGVKEPYTVLSGVAGRWNDMGDYFIAWKDGSEGAVPVCRFYGTPGIGPNSHFYTAGPAECASTKNALGWTYEGIAFYMKRPVNGICPQDTQPVYRYYNNRWMHNDSNHRYATHLFDKNLMIQQGWVLEGVAMCGAG